MKTQVLGWEIALWLGASQFFSLSSHSWQQFTFFFRALICFKVMEQHRCSVMYQWLQSLPKLNNLLFFLTSISYILALRILLVFMVGWYLSCSKHSSIVRGDTVNTNKPKLCVFLQSSTGTHISQEWFDFAHTLLSTQVRLFFLPLAFMHERTYNPVQAEGKYKPAEGCFVPLVFYSVAIVSSNKNESKSGDITWHSNFGDVLLIVVNREVNNIKREGKKAVWGFSQH